MKIRIALESYLSTITNALPTEYENVPFAPVNDVPYQSVYLLRGDTENKTVAYNDKVINSGIFQVTLRYPLANGSAIAENKAYLIKQHFQRGTIITNDDDEIINIEIKKTPNIKVLGVDGNRFLVVVSIEYFIFS